MAARILPPGSLKGILSEPSIIELSNSTPQQPAAQPQVAQPEANESDLTGLKLPPLSPEDEQALQHLERRTGVVVDRNDPMRLAAAQLEAWGLKMFGPSE